MDTKLSRIVRTHRVGLQQLVFKSSWCPTAESPIQSHSAIIFFIGCSIPRALKVRLSTDIIVLPSLFRIVVQIIQASTSFVFFYFSGTNSKARTSEHFPILSYAAASALPNSASAKTQSIFSGTLGSLFFLPKYSFLSRTFGTLQEDCHSS